jgi:hypothetical protein
MKDKSKSMLFDHRPDPVLGAALRDALSADDHATFVARVTASLMMPQRVHWNVLASWAPRGIAVACVAALGAALLVNAMEPPMDLMTSVAAPSARMVMIRVGSPDPGIMLLPHAGR